jgi:hypothetical protein
MRRSHYLVIILLLIAQTSFGQIYQNMAQPGYKFSRARFDSVLTIPTGLGGLRNITGGQDTGQIRFNVSDSSVYVWNGRGWIKPVGGGTTPTLTQVLESAVGANEAGANQIKDLSAGTSQNDAVTFGQLTDTANLRLRLSDTALMLQPYLDTLQAHNTRIIAAGGAAVTVSSYGKNATRDSTILLLSNGTRFAAKDSIGGGGGGSAKAYTPLIVRNDSVYQRFNVLAYGADNTGTTDATVAIQAAINACDAAGGGDVYFPNGIYLIGGAINPTYNSQLYIPSSTTANRKAFNFIGESTNLAPFGGGLILGAAKLPPVNGVVLKSTLTTFTTAGQAVIGTVTSGINGSSLIVKNIGITVKHNPSGTGPVVGGINWSRGTNCRIEDSYAVIDTAGFYSVAPQNNVTGIELPDNSINEFYTVGNCLVGGFFNGYKIGEHALLNNVQAMVCRNGFFIKQGYHTTIATRASAQWCINSIYVQDFTTLSPFNLDVEWQSIGKWYDNVYTIKDTANLSRGQLSYTIIVAGVGKDNTKFSKLGADSLVSSSNDYGILPSDPSLFFDRQNKRLTIGTGGALIGGVASQTQIFSGYSGNSNAILEINTGQTTSSNLNWANLNLVTNQTGTNNAVGSVYFANSAIAAAEKRVAFESVSTDGATNSGRIGWGTMNAGSVATNMTLDRLGRLGIGTTPTAFLHLKAGTATANTAPLKFTAGVPLTTTEEGVLETNANNELLYSTSAFTVHRGFVGLGRISSSPTSFSATHNHSTINFTASGQTLTLPTAVGIGGRIYTIKLSAIGTATVATTSSQTIDGAGSYTLSAQYKYVTVQSDNANWIIIANN